MDATALLAFYDRDQRKEVSYPGFWREERAHVIRHFNLTRKRGEIIYSRLDASNAD